jgi:hypothetical protein
MAINPNTDFTPGAIFTAGQADRFPRGVMAFAESTTNYTLTTSTAIATGMTVTFTAEANRYYRITYHEPQIQTGNAVNANTRTSIRVTNASGTELALTIFQNETAAAINATLTAFAVRTFSAGSITLVGCAVTSSTSGGPIMIRSATAPSLIVVEDMGPA